MKRSIRNREHPALTLPSYVLALAIFITLLFTTVRFAEGMMTGVLHRALQSYGIVVSALEVNIRGYTVDVHVERFDLPFDPGEDAGEEPEDVRGEGFRATVRTDFLFDPKGLNAIGNIRKQVLNLASSEFRPSQFIDVLKNLAEINALPVRLSVNSLSIMGVSTSLHWERKERSSPVYSIQTLSRGRLFDMDLQLATEMDYFASESHMSGVVEGVLPGYQFVFPLTMDVEPVRSLVNQQFDLRFFPEPLAPRGVITVHPAELVVNGQEFLVSAQIHGIEQIPDFNKLRQLRRSPGLPETVQIQVSANEADIGEVFSLLPPGLTGELANTVLEGSLNGDAKITVPLYNLKRIDWDLSLEVFDLDVKSIPENYDVSILSSSFEHKIIDESNGYRARIVIPDYVSPGTAWMLRHSERGPVWIEQHWGEFDSELNYPQLESNHPLAKEEPEEGQADGEEQAQQDDREEDLPTLEYLRLSQISPWVISAVLTGEDGDFFFHRGVDWDTVSDAIARNVAEQSIVLGASTISMQLIKNIFLDDGRELSRKLQEVALVYLMEDHINVPKDRIIEIYLNIAEFGPNIYGIGNAARYYFDKDAIDLNVGEAVWLASILPSPRRYHQYYRNGGISPGWFERMKWYFDTMLERGRMNENEYRGAISNIPSFAY